MADDTNDDYELLRNATERMLWAGASGMEHQFSFETDGGGYYEPRTDHYYCSCGVTFADWTQPDPECTGRPDAVDMLLNWHKHATLAGHPDDGEDQEPGS